jgi:signal transduction histidine kinase
MENMPDNIIKTPPKGNAESFFPRNFFKRLNPSFLPQILAVIVFIVGMASFVGWVFSIPILKSIVPGAIEMKANTSIGIMMASCALFLLGIKKKKKIFEITILALGLFVFLIGLANFAQYIFGWDLNIDEFLFRDKSKIFTVAPGRLAFLTSVSFMAIGLNIILVLIKKVKIFTRLMTIPAIAIGFSVQTGYIWHANEIVTGYWTTPVALNTAFSIMFLGIGLLLASFDQLTFSFNSVEKKIILGFIGTFVLMMLSAGYTYNTTSEYSESVRWVIHTQSVRSELSQLQSSVFDVQFMQRSYLLSENKLLKNDYLQSIAHLNEKKMKLKQLIMNDSNQLQNFNDLEQLINDRINQLNLNIISFEENGDFKKSIVVEKSLFQMKKIEHQVAKMMSYEETLLLAREKLQKVNQEKILLSLLGTIIFSVIILTGLFLGIRGEMEARKAAELLLQTAKDKAEQANRAKDSFLAIMSHEIRTPLTGMLGMLELLSMTPMEEEQATTLDAAWDSGRGLLRIVSDILDWSKIEEGKLELSPRPTSISQLLKDVVNTYSKVASSKSLILWQHSDSRLSSAHIVDSLRLSQVLNNFVSNAIKFTKRGEIEVRAVLLELNDGTERVRFSVKDTGIGISKEVQSRLFQTIVRKARILHACMGEQVLVWQFVAACQS